MRIYLVGFMATGKTTIGKALARSLQFAFRDLDAEVERRQACTIAEIFDLHGESKFRELEAEILRASRDEENLVMATGGGTFCDPRNRDWISEHGLSVWLDLPFSEIARRMGAEQVQRRPLFQNPKQALDLFETRKIDYGHADVIQTLRGDESPTAIAGKLARRIEELRAGTDTF